VLAEHDAYTIIPIRGIPCEAMCWCQAVPHPVLYATGNYISSNEEMDVGASFMTPWQPPLLRARNVIHDALAAPVAPRTERHSWRPGSPRCSAHGTSFMTPWQPPLLRTRGVIHDALAAPVAPHTGRHSWRPGSPLLRARGVMRDAPPPTTTILQGDGGPEACW